MCYSGLAANILSVTLPVIVVVPVVPLSWATSKTWKKPLQFRCYLVYKLRCVYSSGFAAAILGLPTSGYIWPYIAGSAIEFGDLKIMGVAVEILPLFSLQVKRCVVPVKRPPSWISRFRLRRVVLAIVLSPSSWETAKTWEKCCNFVASL